MTDTYVPPSPTGVAPVGAKQLPVEELLPKFDRETYHDDCKRLVSYLTESDSWLPVKGVRQGVQVLMRACDGARTEPFARTQAVMSRDFKLGKQLGEVVQAMNVTPSEFVAAVEYHQNHVPSGCGQGYKQWWPNFVMNFEPIVAEIRRGAPPAMTDKTRARREAILRVMKKEKERDDGQA